MLLIIKIMSTLKCEQYWEQKGFTFISNCMKYCKDKCPYTTGFFHTLYMYNIIYNIPLLIMFARYIKSISHKYSKVVFSARDSSYLYIIYGKLYPTDNIELFLTSRKSYTNPTPDFDRYVEKIIPKNTLVIDLNGTGKSFNQYFTSHLHRSDVNILFLSRLSSCTDMLEFVNYVRYGSLITFNNGNPVFEKLEYPSYIPYTYEKNIMNVLDFISKNININTTKVNFDFIKDYNNLYCQSPQIDAIKKKYHVADHTGLIDISGIQKYRDFFSLFNGEYVNNFPKSYKNIPTYIMHLPKYTERKSHIINILTDLGIVNYTFVTPFPPTEDTRQQLGNFLGCDLSNSKFSLTQMSHSMTYYNILQQTEHDEILLLEDDATLINSIEDTKILFDYIINNCPSDADSIFLEYCYEECKKTYTIFNRLIRPKCLAAVYYPSLNKRTHILNEVKNYCQENECKATDLILANLITNGRIISYEHELLFKQDKQFGSHIEGSLKDAVVPFCGNMKNNPKTLMTPINSTQKNTVASTRPHNSMFIMFIIMLCVLLFGIFGMFIYKLNKPMLFISYIIICMVTFVVILRYKDDDKIYEEDYINTANNLYDHALKQYTKPYNLYSGWERYRLGDMVRHTSWRNKESGEKFHKKVYPNSIATKYMQKTKKTNDIDTLLDIINNTPGEKAPTDVLVLHLRTGDVIEDNDIPVNIMLIDKKMKDNLSNYIKQLSYFDILDKNMNTYGLNKIIIVTGSHMNKNVNHKKSTIYINCIKKFFEDLGKTVILRLGKTPDDDVVFMSSASYFSPSGGGFSNVIKKIVIKRKGIII